MILRWNLLDRVFIYRKIKIIKNKKKWEKKKKKN